MEEVWKDIKDYEGLYQISNLARVRGLDRNVMAMSSNQYSTFCSKYKVKSKVLKQSKERNGYLQVHLCKNGKKKWLKVHRLVAQAFISNPNNLPQVNHKDGNKLNNNIENLEWCTQKYNTQHAYKNNLIKPATSSIKMFDKNGKYICSFDSLKDASKHINRTYSSISCNLNGRTKTCGGYIFKYIKKKLI